MFKCPNCGADLKFSPKDKSVTCKYCEGTFDPKELKVHVKRAQEQNTFEGKSFLCSQCGAELMTFDETAITFCSYCGSQAMLESRMVTQNCPNYIIPFKIDREECIKEYKKVLKKSLFTPSYMKSDITLQKFRGIYMPYCIYTLAFNGKCSNKGSKYSHRKGNYDYYDDYEIDADVNAKYTGISYDLISNFYDDFSQKVPFNFKEVEDFNFNYMSGFYADTKDVDEAIYDRMATSVANADAPKYLSKRKEFSKYGCSNPKIGLSVSKRETGMFPVYFLAVRNKDEKYIHYVVVNGQTGKIAADLPIDFKKYILGSIILAVPIFLLIHLSNIVFTPQSVTVFAIIASVISMIIAANLAKKIKAKETHEDDLGLIVKTKKEVKIKVKTGKYIRKQIFALILGILLLIINPIDDVVFYTGSLITLFLVILTFYSLVKEYNVLVRNKLPQLEKRGGDEHE